MLDADGDVHDRGLADGGPGVGGLQAGKLVLALFSFSTIRMRIFARSCTSIPLQTPESKDCAAASMARRASPWVATGTWAMGSSVAGLMVGLHSPVSASTNLPSM